MGGRHLRTESGGRRRALALVGAIALPVASLVAVPLGAPAFGATTIGATYVAAGPGPITGGQTENIRRSDGTAVEEVAGAVHTVVAHPTDPNTVWIGTTNGGIWKTSNAKAAQPHWVPLTDFQRSLSIGALELDPTVATNTVLVAATGRFSSFGSQGGPRAGVLRTTNGGATWAPLGTAQLTGENLSGVAARGTTIVVASNSGTNFGGGAGLGGIFRSTNTGGLFTRLSGNGTSGLPNQGVFDLVGDPSNNARLYAATQTGIFRSDNTGATWVPAGGTAPNNVTGISIAGGTNNIELAVSNAGGTNAVYAGVINNGSLNGLWRSTDQGANWTQLDSPQTNDGGTINGLQPDGNFRPGGQGGTHFSILADNTDANIVYVGGDRQASLGSNTLGATDFSGRLFRCDASLASGSQCTALTHNQTANASAPHADSREMAFDADGNILETDDGGIYRRTSPRNAAGDWFTVNGDLQIAEHLSCDYDNVADVIRCGNQDTGVPESPAGGGASWGSITTADGGFIAIDDPPGAVTSVRYSSSNRLGLSGFRRQTCTAANVCANSTPNFNVTNSAPPNTQLQTFEQSGGNSTLPLYTPLVMNTVDGDRFIVTSNRVYESTDQLDNLTIINTGLGLDGNGNPARTTRAIAYGGRQGGADAPGVLWYGDNLGNLRLRSAGGGDGSVLPAWTFGNALDIVLDPEDWATAYVTDGTKVYRTNDAGLSFTDISGTLASEAPGAQLWSLEVVPVAGTPYYAVLVGTDAGVYLTQTQNLGTWAKLGGNLPNTNAFDLQYDTVDDVLLVGTQGRGSWLLGDASEAVPTGDLSVTKSDSPDPVKAGEELFYTVTVTNDGPDTAVGVVVVDDLPDEVVYLSDSAGCSYDPLQHRLTCPLTDIPSGGSRSFTIKTLVKPDAVVNEADGTLAIQNTVSVGSASVDTDTSNNTDTETTFVQDKADLRVTKVCKPDDELPAGETGTCTIYVDNLGPSSARDVVLTDTSVSDGEFTFGNITASQGSCDPPANGVVRCELGDLAAASSTETGRATVVIEVSATEDVDINDVADVTSATPDPNTANNQARDSISVMAVADLALVKTGPASAVAGTNMVYNLTLTNNGVSTAQGVVIEDNLPAGVTILSVAGSGGATCNAGVPGNPAQPTTCSFGTVSPAALSNTRTMTITVKVLPGTRGVMHNDARVFSATFDDDLSNNLATVATDVTGSADLSITKLDSPDPVIAGNSLTYTIVVTNNGPSTAEDVTITDTLPAGTTFVSGVNGNGQQVCALVQSATVVCDLDDLEPGATATVYLTVQVEPSVPPGTLTNTVQVASATSDPNPGNNTATEQTQVITSAELWLDKQATQRSGNPSPIVTYTLVVHNNAGCETDAQSSQSPNCGAGGPSDAQNITVVDTLPLDPKKMIIQYLSPQCTYSKATHKVTCTAAKVPAGATVTFVIEAQVQGSVGTITNTATVSSTTTDPVISNNTNAASLVMKGGTGKK